MSIIKNKMNLTAAFAFCFCVLIVPFTLHSTGINLLKNPGFEDVTENMPSYWDKNGWITDDSVTTYHLSTDRPHSGKLYIVIQNAVANDARFIQRVAVEPNTIYKMSGWIKTENVGNANTGANITILQDSYVDHSSDIKGTSSEWQYVEFYIRTKKDQTEVIVAARLGGFSQINTGVACFDDLEFSEELHVVNESDISKSSVASKYISDLASTGSSTSNGQNNTQAVQSQQAAGAHTTNELPFQITLTYALIFLGLVFAMYYLFIYRGNKIKLNDKTLYTMFLFLLLAGLVVRIVIAFNFEGYHNDTESFKAWAVRSSTFPLNEFYDKKLFADYPPGYIYILWMIGHFGRLLSIDYNTPLYILLLKLPGILADLGAALVIFVYARKKLNIQAAFGLGVIYAFNPVIIFTSSFWGQMDSIPALLCLLVIFFILKDKHWIAALILGFDIIIKLQSGVLVFILLFAVIAKKDLKTWIFCIVAGLASFTLPLIPFIPEGENIFFIFGIIMKTVTQYGYASVNAFNLMGLFGGNWVPIGNTFFIFSYTIWGYIFLVSIIAFAAILYFRMKDEAKIFFVTGVFYILVFLLMSAMHERYGYTALVLLMMSFIFMNKKGLFALFAGFSITMYINIAYVLDFFMRGEFVFAGDPVEIVIAIINLGLMGYMLKMAIDFIIDKKPEIAGNGNLNHDRLIVPVSNKRKKAEIAVKSIHSINKLQTTEGKYLLIGVERGSGGEPYCSQKCRETSENKCGTLLFKKAIGTCWFCGIQVSLGSALLGQRGNGIGFPLPGHLELVCNSCISSAKAKEHIAKITECCECGKRLT